jgi:NADH:ubiquinone oxidoreductase subunit H
MPIARSGRRWRCGAGRTWSARSGVLQSFADGLKVFLQETIIPSASNRGLFLIAPIITFTVALMAWAVIPFNSGAVLADINVGLLYILAISQRWAFMAS